eukprot:CAMPEP_0179210060 /NCGR_PEP_ID=MMETSP0796-20121207/104768_1 /TAXON_ID=73915 /ORGANISM="Pyrodinium bahamense, Strain pbaha01" /LENGTH=93 /DNA_ID=CAMNT_0020915025 /DNA_START=124 /DNA_END=401 /DNA_ORIENTATION=-
MTVALYSTPACRSSTAVIVHDSWKGSSVLGTPVIDPVVAIQLQPQAVQVAPGVRRVLVGCLRLRVLGHGIPHQEGPHHCRVAERRRRPDASSA